MEVIRHRVTAPAVLALGAFVAGVIGIVSALTPGETGAAFRKWVDPAKLSVVRAGDFANAKAGAK